MKTKILLSLLVIANLIGISQNNNPYNVFGYTSKVEYKEKKSQLFRVSNPDNCSDVKALAFDFENKFIYYLGINDTTLKALPITDEMMVRFLSVDPLTKQYPGLTPYQFAGNTPIAASDLDGKEPDIKFESGYSAQMVGKEGVDLKVYNKAFDMMSGDGGAAIGMAGSLVGAAASYFTTPKNNTPNEPKPGTSSNNPRTPSSEAKIKKVDAEAVKPAKLGDLTPTEVEQIQNVVNQAERPIEVAGSAAKGARRNIGTDLPVGKGSGTKSDIDYLAPPSSIKYFENNQSQLPGLDPKTGIIPGTGNSNIGPYIRFEPNAEPTVVPYQNPQ